MFSGGGFRINTRKIFRNLDRATPEYPRSRRAHPGTRGPDIVLKRRRLRNRRSRRAESGAVEILGALAFASLALGYCVRRFAGRTFSVPAFLLLPFAGVALLGIWGSRMPTARKILWSVPPLAFTIPFLPIG